MNFIIEGIRAQAEENPAALALVTDTRRISYSEILKDVAIVSNFLAAQNIAAKAKVFLNIKDPDLRLVASLAAMHNRLIPLVLRDPREFPETIAADLVLAGDELAVEGLAGNFTIGRAVLADSAADTRLRDFGEPAEGDIFYIASTTGTTGLPKLIADRYGALKKRYQIDEGAHRNAGSVAPRSPPYLAGDRVLVTVGELSKQGFARALRLLACGATLVRAHPDAQEMLKSIETFGVNHILTTPSAMDVMTRHLLKLKTRLSSVKYIHLSGSLFTRALVEDIERCFSGQIWVHYGSAECNAISRAPIDSKSFRPGYVGEIVHGIECVDSGSHESPGPVAFSTGENLFSNYFGESGNSAGTAKYFLMPDLGYVEGKSIFLTGRSDEVFNFSGNKVSFNALEGALRGTAGVVDVGVIHNPAELHGLIVGVVGEIADFAPLAKAIVAVVRAAGAPKAVIFFHCPAIPRNATGKVDRQALLTEFLEATG